MNYYNEIESYAAEWLRNLIKAGHIPHGEVDTRSIVDVSPLDLRGFTQCHFFAGIGGWSHALRLAGWPDDRPIWTGSCPCQPFSVAGKGAGTNDPRHLWPHFHRLIAACRPPVVLGEQVAGKAGYGWFDGVRADLEGIGYSSRAVDIPALAVGAPHIRQRLYWGAADLENTDREHGKCGQVSQPVEICATESGTRSDNYVSGRCSLSHMADAQQHGRGGKVAPSSDERQEGERSTDQHVRRGGSSLQFWSDAVWLTGSDGKARRSKPGLPLLVNGVPLRVGRLRAYGNAVVPQLAAEVIKAFMDS